MAMVATSSDIELNLTVSSFLLLDDLQRLKNDVEDGVQKRNNNVGSHVSHVETS